MWPKLVLPGQLSATAGAAIIASTHWRLEGPFHSCPGTQIGSDIDPLSTNIWQAATWQPPVPNIAKERFGRPPSRPRGDAAHVAAPHRPVAERERVSP